MASGLKSSQKLFEVKWNCQHSTIISLLQKDFEAQKFTDVTLSCQGRSIQCHQLVLRASSTYFEMTLEERRCDHPMILLNVVTFPLLEKVLEFMYKGIIRIKEDEMSGFFQAAAKLKVKGLFAENEKAVVVPGPTVNEPLARSAQAEKQAVPALPAKKKLHVHENHPQILSTKMATAIQNVLVGVPASVAAKGNDVPLSTLYSKLRVLGIPMLGWAGKDEKSTAETATGNKVATTGVEAAASENKAQGQSGNDDDGVIAIAEIQRSNIGRNSAGKS